MNVKLTLLIILALVFTIIAGCTDSDDDDEQQVVSEGEIWVANRVGGSISVIDVSTDTVINTITLPNNGEPMYVNYVDYNRQVFIGDRANNLVLVFDADSKELADTINAGNGVFHQWISPDSRQFYVNNDIDLTTSVINSVTLQAVNEIDMPTDLATLGGKPHDVFVDPTENAIFVSYLGFGGEHDFVVRFDSLTLEETHRAEVGIDPHLFAVEQNSYLYVPGQGSDQVSVLSRANLEVVKVIDVPGAHGIIGNPSGTAVYVTNLPGGGENAVYTILTSDNSPASSTGVDSIMEGSPHNLAISDDGRKLYLTHSGADANKVSVFTINQETQEPTLLTDVTVGNNPFGLGFVPKTGGSDHEEYTKVYYNVSELSTLRDGHHYEGWAIYDGDPVSTGKFNVDASGVATDLDGIAIPNGEFEAGRDLSIADALVLTIEIPGDVDIVPNETHYLAGNISGTNAIMTVTHGDALGDDFLDAEGSYILATPTDGPDTNENSGVWFLSLRMQDPVAGLSLPQLPVGWSYEGWAVIAGQPVTTGKFTAVDMEDDSAPYSDTIASPPPFPGEDFLFNAPEGLEFPLDLSESTIVVSIEPVPDDSIEPFLLKPLAGNVPSNAADHQTFDLSNIAMDFPVVTATLRQ